MQKAYDEDADWEEVEGALYENSADMVTAIEGIYGEEEAAEFDRIFTEHNDYTADIVEATQNEDADARAAAEEEVEDFVLEFSEFLAITTDGNLPQEAAEEAIRAHEMDVLNTFDHYVAGEYEEAYGSYREGFDRMFDIGEALSGAIVAQNPDMFEGSAVDTPASDLRATLNHLAGEHYALATLEMQKGFDQAEDFDFVIWAEDMHTADFKAAIESIYGSEGAAEFERIWQGNHIDAQSNLVAATIEGNDEAREQALADLETFAMDFGEFLGTATEGNLPVEAAQEAVWAHEENVVNTFDHYVSEDYESTYESFREGYAMMFDIGEVLGDAIVTQMPAEFGGEVMPEEMPQTGLGGASQTTSATMMMAYIAFAAAVIGTGGYVIRKRMGNNA